MAVQNPPPGTTAVTPHLVIDGAAKAIEFYKKAFNAQELFRFSPGGDKIMHAQIAIDGAKIMMCDAMPEKGASGPEKGKPQPQFIYLYVKDVDATMKAAEDAGAKVVYPVQNYFYGDRAGLISDPFGHVWWIATHVEDVAPDELERRGKAEMEKAKKAA